MFINKFWWGIPSPIPPVPRWASEASPTTALHSTLHMCAVSCSVLVFHLIAHEFSKQLVGVSLGSVCN